MVTSTTTTSQTTFSAKDYPATYLAASGLAAAINYPLWRSAAVGQSGYVIEGVRLVGLRVPTALQTYVYGFLPPYKGMLATVFGMTWARAAIFYGSDALKDTLRQTTSPTVATVVPPLFMSTMVQIINQPIVRATITLQDPANRLPNVPQSLYHIYTTHGVRGLWHGTSAALLKTVPKYCTAIVVKDAVGDALQQQQEGCSLGRLEQSAIKAVAAGVAGAFLTNPLDVLRNEMFKHNTPLVETYRELVRESGYQFMVRGMGKNLIAVAMPVACTIFFTDALVQLNSKSYY